MGKLARGEIDYFIVENWTSLPEKLKKS